MKVTLLTAASPEYWQLLEIGAPNKLEYCLRHKVQFHVAQHEPHDGFNYWGERESFMLDALDTYDSEWVWFMGADTLITDMTKDIRKLCDPEMEFIIGLDINGINNDSTLLRNCLRVKSFLKHVMYRRDKQTDQCAMNIEMRKGLRTKIVGQREFNSFKYDEYHYGEYPEGNWQPGDFVIHFPGMSNQRRIPLMKEYLKKVKR